MEGRKGCFLSSSHRLKLSLGNKSALEWIKSAIFALCKLEDCTEGFSKAQNEADRRAPARAEISNHHKGDFKNPNDGIVGYAAKVLPRRFTTKCIMKSFRLGLILVVLAYVVAFSSVYRGTEEDNYRTPTLTQDMRQLLSLKISSDHPSNSTPPAAGIIKNLRKKKFIFLRNRSFLALLNRSALRLENPPPSISTSMIKRLGIRRLKMGPRLAICLVGGAREFQLTGPTILTHLLAEYSFADVFLHSPLDENSHKFSILQAAAPNLVNVRVVPDVPVPESPTTDALLQWVKAGPEHQPRQQLLQQFKGIETCNNMIIDYENRKKIKYQWILRTRVDGHWSAKPPSISSLSSKGYTIPSGSDWGGLNDRLSVGRRETSINGLRRLAALKDLVTAGYRNLNAERTYDAQLELLKVQVSRASFPFCILSHKRTNVAFPMVPSISSEARLNGAKCRPCNATLTGWEAREYIAELPKRLYGPDNKGVDLCEASSDWHRGWESVFDANAGPEASRVRKYMSTRTLAGCLRDWQVFQSTVSIWDSPPAIVFCVRQHLGPISKLGAPAGHWPVFLKPLSPRSVVYVTAAGDQTKFDIDLIRLVKCKVHGFDLTPNGLLWLAEHIDTRPLAWHHYPWLLSTINGETKVYPLYLDGRPVEYAMAVPEALEKSKAKLTPIGLESKQIESTMKLLKHKRIDLLRIVGHYSHHESLFKQWIARGATPKVCQVAISYHRKDKHFGSPEGGKQLEELRKIGLELAGCIQSSPELGERDRENCLFFSIYHCGIKNPGF